MMTSEVFFSTLQKLYGLIELSLSRDPETSPINLDTISVKVSNEREEISMRSLFLICQSILRILLSIEKKYTGFLKVLDVNIGNEGGNSSKVRGIVEYLNSTLAYDKSVSNHVGAINSQMYELSFSLLRFIATNKNKVSTQELKEILKMSRTLGFDGEMSPLSYLNHSSARNDDVDYAQETYNLLESKVEAVRQLESEFQSLLSKVRAQYDVVAEQRRVAEQFKDEIDSIIGQAKTVTSDAKIKAEDVTTRLSDLESMGEETYNKYMLLQGSMNSSKNSIEELVKSAESTKERLQQLLDPAVALDLLSTFKRRKRWLFISTLVWASLGLASAVTLGLQTSVLLTAPGDLSLERTLSISLRILPFIVLLFFCLRQFTKNRNLEEEYAFRESIATSMMSYVEKIEGDTKLKEELIRDTVLKLYTSPLAKIAEASHTSSESKQSESLIQSIADLLKQTTSAVKKSE